jgi:hypothetical protein
LSTKGSVIAADPFCVMEDESVKALLRVAIALLCVGAVAFVFAIVSSEPTDVINGRVIETTILLVVAVLIAAAGANLVARQPRMAFVGFLTIAAAVVSFALIAKLIWNDSLLSAAGGTQWTQYSLIAAIALGNMSALLSGYDDSDADSVKIVRLATVLALWALVITVIAEIRAGGPDVDPRQLAVTAVVYGLGVIVLPLLRRA